MSLDVVLNKYTNGEPIFINEIPCKSKNYLRQELKKIEYANIKVKLIEPGAYATGFNKENYLKKYEWMKNSSYFKFRLDTLKYKEERTWNFIESKNFKSIIKKYVKAVEANNNKFRYSAPFIQYIFTKLRVLFGIS